MHAHVDEDAAAGGRVAKRGRRRALVPLAAEHVRDDSERAARDLRSERDERGDEAAPERDAKDASRALQLACFVAGEAARLLTEDWKSRFEQRSRDLDVQTRRHRHEHAVHVVRVDELVDAAVAPEARQARGRLVHRLDNCDERHRFVARERAGVREPHAPGAHERESKGLAHRHDPLKNPSRPATSL